MSNITHTNHTIPAPTTLDELIDMYAEHSRLCSEHARLCDLSATSYDKSHQAWRRLEMAYGLRCTHPVIDSLRLTWKAASARHARIARHLDQQLAALNDRREALNAVLEAGHAKLVDGIEAEQ